MGLLMLCQPNTNLTIGIRWVNHLISELRSGWVVLINWIPELIDWLRDSFSVSEVSFNSCNVKCRCSCSSTATASPLIYPLILSRGRSRGVAMGVGGQGASSSWSMAHSSEMIYALRTIKGVHGAAVALLEHLYELFTGKK